MNKVALITGAGSGIGRCSALALVREGYAVVLTGRRVAALHETAARARPSSAAQILIVQSDVADPASVAALFEKTASTFGRLDLLFNNAGVNIPPGPMEDITFEQWRSVTDTIVTGSFLCTQAAFKLMKSQKPKGGRIINNGSISAHVPRPFSAPYTAAKHAITGLTKSTALDGRIHKIACGQIDIGNAATEMTRKIQMGVPQADGSVAAEPTMSTEDVARAVVYMASLPLEANVLSMTVMATQMPFLGRG
jgi:NAD(P)-dependent dehydrogenase (short-subunit alcohol dehydrogenase family)